MTMASGSTDALLVKKTKNGHGVFANKNFKKRQSILRFRGRLFTFDQLPTPYDAVEDHYVQIGKTLYLGPSGSTDDFFNHSCDPNAGLVIDGKKIVLVAIKDIKKGMQITWDYSTTMDEDDFEMDCYCGSRNCRKRIRDFKYLPKTIQQRYIDFDVVPKYVLDSCGGKEYRRGKYNSSK